MTTGDYFLLALCVFWIFVLVATGIRIAKLPTVYYPTYERRIIRNGNKYLRSRSFYNDGDFASFWKVCFWDDGEVWLLTYGASHNKTIVRRIM